MGSENTVELATLHMTDHLCVLSYTSLVLVQVLKYFSGYFYFKNECHDFDSPDILTLACMEDAGKRAIEKHDMQKKEQGKTGSFTPLQKTSPSPALEPGY